MSIAEQVQQLESDRDSLHRSYQGKVDELKCVRDQFDKYKADFGHLPREVQRLTSARDQWKERAEKAEEYMVRNQWVNADAHYETVQTLIAERDHWRSRAEAAEEKVDDLERELAARTDGVWKGIALLQRELNQAAPEVIKSVLEAYTPKQHTPATAEPSQPQPTPNPSETPNSSPSQPDCVEELLVGDWYVSFDRNGVVDISAKGGGIVMSCSASHSTVDFVQGLCQRINRYRRIRDEVGAYVTQAPGHDYPPMECVYRLVKIINGKEAAK